MKLRPNDAYSDCEQLAQARKEVAESRAYLAVNKVSVIKNLERAEFRIKTEELRQEQTRHH